MIKVLVVDDSVFMRQAITKMLASESDIEVIDTARNGKEAIEKVATLKPDVVTMDVEMPIMNGIESLRQIMDSNPVPVIMVSAVTTEGAQQTLDALSLGAVDFIAKRAAFVNTELYGMKEELVAKVRQVGGNRMLLARIQRRRATGQGLPQPSSPDRRTSSTPSSLSQGVRKSGRKRPGHGAIDLVIIGVSTGGPLALHQVIPRLPQNLPVPILIVQHMPPHFTKSLADRLNGLSQVAVSEAEDGNVLQRGHVYIAPGGKQMLITRGGKITISSDDFKVLYKPSVDVTAGSALEYYAGRILTVIMTGMGRDGADSFKKIVAAGGYCLAQNEESCVVYGMPKSVVDDGTADEVLPLDQLADAISAIFGLSAQPTTQAGG